METHIEQFKLYYWWLWQSQLNKFTINFNMCLQKVGKLASSAIIKAGAYKILQYPAPELLTKCQPVTFPLSREVVQEIYYLKACLKQALAKYKCLGLSANQVGFNSRFFVTIGNVQHSLFRDVITPNFARKLDVIINSEILERSEDTIDFPQYCLSSPDIHLNAKRSRKIKIRYFNMNGSEKVTQIEGGKAVLFQHQYDHMEGLTIHRFLQKKQTKEQPQNANN